MKRQCLGPCGRNLHFRDDFERMLLNPVGLEDWCNVCYLKQVQWCHKLFMKRLSSTAVPRKCQVCKRVTVLKWHHVDYNMPYLVQWLCRDRCYDFIVERELENVRTVRYAGDTPKVAALRA